MLINTITNKKYYYFSQIYVIRLFIKFNRSFVHFNDKLL